VAELGGILLAPRYAGKPCSRWDRFRIGVIGVFSLATGEIMQRTGPAIEQQFRLPGGHH